MSSVVIVRQSLACFLGHRVALCSGVEQVTSDMLGLMMMAEDAETGKGMSNEELRDQVMTLMLAGHEVSTVITSQLTQMRWTSCDVLVDC